MLGLGPIAKLPATAPGPGFSQERLAGDRGAGVEIVLEVEDLDAAFARAQVTDHPIAESPRLEPWGLRDFRLADPDGYYLRVTTPDPSAGSGGVGPGPMKLCLLGNSPCRGREGLRHGARRASAQVGHDALKDSGHRPKVVRTYGFAALPTSRAAAARSSD